MQRYTLVFITTNVEFHLTHNSGKKQKNLDKISTNTRCCVYSFELLMMGGETA